MNHVRKMKLVPFDFDASKNNSEPAQYGGEIKEEKPNIIRDKYKMKLVNMLKIMSKLASLQSYDEYGRIKNKNGSFIEKTDIVELILNAMSPGKILNGEERFIELLKEAKITPDMIFNDSIKVKLSVYNFSDNEVAQVIPVIEGTKQPEYEVVYKKEPLKRKRSEDIEESIEEVEPIKKQKLFGNGIKWTVLKKKKS